ncbi:Undecaprenyl-phosphate4-deoxy-4-formamido-L-arabinose transferase [Apilactobacillus kunkeei]|nr:Undecaprenyl-phosphate4-deoxy-4-formamido-L-arabinose transferase [Apilactobacillus kunkeei]CAI2649188.1 Undecaprenyl-phosphate4-deoxy-4-formamido-L-arabinose transferase [Apilactobacillus kunkeei]CAI2803192.1 Undecaprenyl-phosphate4-deoxy-4-formamido-L-arabinose transferase [Apilactobacillus kunkeei]
MSPVISVIIPIYNAERRLNNIFSQLSKQSLDNKYFEIIFVNDGSKDQSEKIIQDFIVDKTNYHLLNQENKKQAEARNNGIRNAKGNYLLFVDDDDVLDSNYLKTFYNNACGYNIVFSGIKKTFPNGEEIEENTVLHDYKYDDKSSVLNSYLVRGKESDSGVWAKMYRREFIKENNIFFDNENFFEDSLFNFKALLAADLSTITTIDYYGYRLIKHCNTTTNSFHSELDYLVDSYISKIRYLLSANNLSKIKMESFIDREFVYVVHHHIKFDTYDSSKKISQKLKIKNVFDKLLPLKYKVSILMMKISFPLYYFVYKYRNSRLFRGEKNV